MRISWFLFLPLALFPLEAWTQTPAPTPPKKISRPLFLKPTDKIPLGTLRSPGVPDQGRDGNPLGVDESIYAPPADILDKLSDPGLFEEIKKAKKKENQVNRIYWHTSTGWEYCHFRDEEGNHWYGWNDRKAFHWVLWRGDRYWWHDDFAGNWLYYFRGYWLRAHQQSSGDLQVLINSEYYVCQKDGTITKDMGQDGKGGIVSGNGPFRGDFHHEGNGHGNGHPWNGSKASLNTGMPGSSPSN